MPNAIIVNDCENDSLLRFTQTKLFFDAKNKARNYFTKCTVVDSYSHANDIANDTDVILEIGDFLTTGFYNRITKYARDSDDVIKFDKRLPIDFKRRRYLPGSKQLYIIENLLKICLQSKKLVYLDNNERVGNIQPQGRHLYGLASGYKTVKYALAHNFETVTVYDYCERQLEYAQWLHSQPQLPDTVDVEPPVSGEYNVPDLDWEKWHNLDVSFVKLNLFDIPTFPKESFIWTSNVFMYEPTMFEFGYQHVVNCQNRLQEQNKYSIITEN